MQEREQILPGQEISGVIGFSCFCPILELFLQEKRVAKGWFPSKSQEKGFRIRKEGRSTCFGLLAPLMFEILNLWEGFRKVVDFIENNRTWLLALLSEQF